MSIVFVLLLLKLFGLVLVVIVNMEGVELCQILGFVKESNRFFKASGYLLSCS